MKILVATLLLCAAIPAVAQPQPPAQCLRLSEIDDYQGVPGGRSVIVLDNLKQRFEVSFTQRCSNLGKYANLVFVGRAPGRLACALKGDTVLSRAYGGPPDRCIISSVTPYDGPIGSDRRMHN